jgi:excisionase family DNA binding protein
LATSINAPMSVREVGSVLGVSHKTVMRWIEAGTLPATKVETAVGRYGFRYEVAWDTLVEFDLARMESQ